ncbi:MAG: trypsin-like peptidase domain-containing protein [Actinomycetota bacterium]|nr:trypsin-like peptidase domain-containing protein [Actinomycetota bacterium]
MTTQEVFDDMIDQEATQEITSPTPDLEPAADAPEPEAPDRVSAPSPLPAKPARRHVWLNLVSAMLLVAASSGITYLLVTDSGPDTEVVAGSQSDAGGDAPTVVPADEPIANAAAVILPSVVQIQSGGGVGSGVIYDSDGLILTAAHVVAGADTVTVRFNDGEEIQGTVLGGTSGADVAVIQVDRTGLEAADLALGEDPLVGQMAIAVGSPWGLQGTVTAGIISAVDQSIPSGGSARAVLQTDAAINPGNSGGPLVDREGRVLGINVSIFSLSGANDGVGFAVPIDVASDIAEQVVAGDSIETAFLGVSLGIVESGQAGALIAEVTPGSAADEAGVEVGDLILSIDGVQVQGGPDLAAQVQTHRPGTTVEIVLMRDGEQHTVNVTLDQRPADVG